MQHTPSIKPMRRALVDAGLGLILFAAFVFCLVGASGLPTLNGGRADAAEIAKVAAFTGPMASLSEIQPVAAKSAVRAPSHPSAQTGLDQTAAILVLGAIFAVLFAFNLAFFRHLRQVCDAPRRRGLATAR